MSATFRAGLGSEPEAHTLWKLLNDNRVNKLVRVDQVDNKVTCHEVPQSNGSGPSRLGANVFLWRESRVCGRG